MVFLVFGVIALLMLVAVLKRPSTALVGVVCMFALEQWAQASSVFFLTNRTLVNVMVGVLVVVGVIGAFLKGQKPLKRYPLVGWLVLALFGYALLSIAWVTDPAIALEKWAERAPYIVTFVVLAPLLVSRDGQFLSAFRGILVLGTLLTFLLLFTVKWHYRFVLLAGDAGLNYGNPLAPAEVAGNVIIIALLIRLDRGRMFWAVAKWAVVLGCLILVIKSGSRGQLLGLSLAVLLGWPLSRRISGMKGIGSLALGLAIVAVGSVAVLNAFLAGDIGVGSDEIASYSEGAMKERWTGEAMEEAMSGRLGQVGHVLEIWSQSPFTILFGLGNSASYDPKILGIYPHFVPGEILAEEGIMGLALYVAILALCVRNTARAYSASKDDPVAHRNLAIVVGILAYSFMLSLKQGSMLGNVQFFMWATLLGRFALAATQSLPRKKMLVRPSLAGLGMGSRLQGGTQ